MRRALAALGAAAVLAACAGSTGRELTVSAAASLTDAFTEIGTAFEAANPGIEVVFNFGPSDGLATQIVSVGGLVDVFASASPRWMDVVAEEGPGVAGRADFASNRLAVLVPDGNPAGVERLGDLARDGVRLVLAAEGVPAGDYAREVLVAAGIEDAALANLVSNEEDVRGVVTKVVSGDADVGIAYVTDVSPTIADRVELVSIPDDVNVIAVYPIAVIAGSEEEALAQRFVDFVLREGREILDDHGFLPPP